MAISNGKTALSLYYNGPLTITVNLKKKKEKTNKYGSNKDDRPGQSESTLECSITLVEICKHITGADSSVGRVSTPGNGRSRVQSRAATYQSR